MARVGIEPTNQKTCIHKTCIHQFDTPPAVTQNKYSNGHNTTGAGVEPAILEGLHFLSFAIPPVITQNKLSNGIK